MWFGTLDGLNRFDGNKITIFKRKVKILNSLSDNNIKCLSEDTAGNLWVGTSGGGLNRFDPSTETFTHFKHDPEDPFSLSNNFINVIFPDSSGYLWIGTNGGGLNIFNLQTEQFTSHPLTPAGTDQSSKYFILSIAKDHGGNIWIGTSGGLFKLSNDRKGVEEFLSQNQINCLYIDSQNRLWAGTSKGLKTWIKGTKNFLHYTNNPADPSTLSSNNVRTIYEDSSGTLWIGTNGGGLNRLNQEDNTFTHYQVDYWNLESISDNNIHSIFEDRSGVLWICTNNGISRLRSKTKHFKRIRSFLRNPNSLSNNMIWSVFEDSQGILWVGTDNGLNRVDRKLNRFTHYFHDETDSRSLSNNQIRDIFEDSRGNLWIGTDGGGLDLMDRRRETFKHMRYSPFIPSSLSSNQVRVIYEDKKGCLWVGTVDAGINLLAAQGDEGFERFTHNPRDPHSLGDNEVYAILEDSHENIWIGTMGGLERFSRKTGQFTHFKNDPTDPFSISDDGVSAIYEDIEKTLWIGTDAGLNRFERDTNTFTHYTVNDGLANDFIYGILEDSDGNLWLSTNGGLTRFNKKTEIFRNYDTFDGLLSAEFNAGAFFKNKNGEMFFGSLNGLNHFFPKEITDNSYIPRVVLTSIVVFDKPFISDKPVYEVEHIRLSHKDAFFWFEFAALDYNAPEKNKYAYMMEGFDKKWHEAGPERRATYTNLDPGKYTFRVKGSNNDGAWNEEGISIRLEIVPPYWQQWWFRITLITGIIGTALLIYWKRLSTIRAQRNKLEELVNEKTIQLRRANEELEKLASEDSLTGVANRRTFQNHLEIEWKLAKRGKKPLSLIMLDVDFFKLYNDTYGHQAGDVCLQKIANTLVASVNRPADFIGRYGGDEFAIILSDADLKGVIHISKKIKQHIINREIAFNNSSISDVITVSLGVTSVVPTDSKNSEVLILYADKALLRAKKQGRNCIHIFNTRRTLL